MSIRTPREKWDQAAAMPDGPLPKWLARPLAMLMPRWVATLIVARHPEHKTSMWLCRTCQTPCSAADPFCSDDCRNLT